MSTADEVRIRCGNKAAFTISGGYAVSYDGTRTLFPSGTIIEEKRNKEGRCTKCVVKYGDGSLLTYTYSGNTGAYSLTVKNP